MTDLSPVDAMTNPMTQEELDTVLKNLNATELVTGMDLSIPRWASQRKYDLQTEAGQNANPASEDG